MWSSLQTGAWLTGVNEKEGNRRESEQYLSGYVENQ